MIERRRSDFLRPLVMAVRALDPVLMLILAGLLSYAVFVMGSAAPGLIGWQFVLVALALSGMWIVACIPSQRLLSLAPLLYIVGFGLLVAVHLKGVTSKGAQRWLAVGDLPRIQPSEIMKIAMPLTLAWFFQKRENFADRKNSLFDLLFILLPWLLGIALFAAAAYLFFVKQVDWKIPIGTLALALTYGALLFVQSLRQNRKYFIETGQFLFAAALLAGPVFLIAKQPDLGTAVLVSAGGGYVIFFAGLPWKLIVPVMLAGIAAIAAIGIYGDRLCAPEVEWPLLHGYQKDRVCTLLDPRRDPLGKGFHIIQSTIAIGSGGISGKGWREGTQTQLSFLPERHTDFVFAVLAEELGFFGGMILMGLYLALLLRGFFIAASATSLGTKLLAGSITMVFFTYLFVNIGMVSGILPVVGVPLPFISYGGTALVTLCLGVGILMSICRNKTPER